MSKIDLTTGKKPDLEIEEIRVLGINNIPRARVKFLRKRKADRNDSGMICLSCGFHDPKHEQELYIEDEKHAKTIIEAINIAINLKWFQERK